MSQEPLTFVDPEVQRCPFPAYAQLRELKPVYKDPVSGNYILTRYDDIRKVLMDTKIYSNSTGLANTRQSEASETCHAMFRDNGWLPIDTLVTADPPVHRTYRVLVEKIFSHQRVNALVPTIEQVTRELIADFADSGRTEFVSSLAIPLPMRMIADQLGVDYRDIDDFKRWSDAGIELTGPGLAPAREIELTAGMIELQQYLAERIKYYETNPTDNILTSLVHAPYQERRLNMAELVNIAVQLIVAGNETTTNAISSGIRLLVEEAGLVERLRADLTTIPKFVEEVLRLSAPLQTLFRRAKVDVTISEVDIPAEAIIEVRYGAGNHDPSVFQDPTEVRLDRKNGNQHLTFGSGIHLCIGNQLARREINVALTAVIETFDDLRYANVEEPVKYHPSYIGYGPAKLDVLFTRRLGRADGAGAPA